MINIMVIPEKSPPEEKNMVEVQNHKSTIRHVGTANPTLLRPMTRTVRMREPYSKYDKFNL